MVLATHPDNGRPTRPSSHLLIVFCDTGRGSSSLGGDHRHAQSQILLAQSQQSASGLQFDARQCHGTYRPSSSRGGRAGP